MEILSNDELNIIFSKCEHRFILAFVSYKWHLLNKEYINNINADKYFKRYPHTPLTTIINILQYTTWDIIKSIIKYNTKLKLVFDYLLSNKRTNEAIDLYHDLNGLTNVLDMYKELKYMNIQSPIPVIDNIFDNVLINHMRNDKVFCSNIIKLSYSYLYTSPILQELAKELNMLTYMPTYIKLLPRLHDYYMTNFEYILNDFPFIYSSTSQLVHIYIALIHYQHKAMETEMIHGILACNYNFDILIGGNFSNCDYNHPNTLSRLYVLCVIYEKINLFDILYQKYIKYYTSNDFLNRFARRWFTYPVDRLIIHKFTNKCHVTFNVQSIYSADRYYYNDMDFRAKYNFPNLILS